MAKFTISTLSLSYLFFLATICAAQTNGGATTAAGGGGGAKGAAAGELWCVAKNNAEDAALQSALDWACGAGGANCAPIQQGGPCYDPSDIQRTASYAFNDYFLKHGMAQDSCNFDNTAALTSLNPSHSNCKFPSSFSASNGSFTGTTSGGIGPASADLSSGSSVFSASNLGLVAIHMFFTISLIFLRD